MMNMRYRHLLINLLLMGLAACQADRPSVTPTVTEVIVEPTESAIAPIDTVTAPPPTSTPTPIGPRRVVMVSIDGGGYDVLNTILSSGDGGTARVQQVDPATTLVSHTSLACGCWPSQSGIVGERIHQPDDAFYWYTSAYDLPIVVQPVWKMAGDAGLETAVLFWPGVDLESAFLPDVYIGSGELDALSNQHQLVFVSAGQWENAPESMLPLLESRFRIEDDEETIALINVLAAQVDADLDSYDTFIFSKDDKVIDDGDLQIAPAADQWGYWWLTPESAQGVDLLITDSAIASFTVFQSRVYRLTTAPDMIGQKVGELFGSYPPPPDYYANNQGWITDDDFLVMLERQSQWMMDVTLWIDETYQPDLMMTVQYPLNQIMSQFDAAEYDALYEQAYTALASNLSRLYQHLEDEIVDQQTTFILAGTAPTLPVEKQVHLNVVLEQAGFLTLDSRNFVVVEQSQAIAFTSGGTAHVYVNETVEDAESLLSDLVGLFQVLTDPETGKAVLTVIPESEFESYHVGGDYTGQLVVQAEPGYYLSDWRGANSIFESPIIAGAQGYPATLDQMQGYFWVQGGGLQARNLHLLDIAPTILQLLGVPIPDGLPGTPLLPVN